jgi:hypothetical protein
MVAPLTRISAEVRDLAVAITCGRYELSLRGFKSLTGPGRDSVRLPLHTLGGSGATRRIVLHWLSFSRPKQAAADAGGGMSEVGPVSAVAPELPCERGAPAIVH